METHNHGWGLIPECIFSAPLNFRRSHCLSSSLSLQHHSLLSLVWSSLHFRHAGLMHFFAFWSRSIASYLAQEFMIMTRAVSVKLPCLWRKDLGTYMTGILNVCQWEQDSYRLGKIVEVEICRPGKLLKQTRVREKSWNFSFSGIECTRRKIPLKSLVGLYF